MSSAGGASAVRRIAEVAPPASVAKERHPVVELCFDVPADRRVVTGRETIQFEPDFPACDAVFRAWPNKPATARAGNRLDITSVTVDGVPVRPMEQAAGAPPDHPGTLIRVTLPRCTDTGATVTIELDFTLRLGEGTPERLGYSGDDRTAWIGTGFPLLAWERERGWAVDPAVDLFGETVVSETFRLDRLDVIAPEADRVLGVGRAVGNEPGPRPGTVRHQFTAPAVRDVAIAVGRMELTERTVEGVRLHIATPTGTRSSRAEWIAELGRSIRDLSAYLGPFPYDDLWVTVVPEVETGIEFPGAILFGDVDLDNVPELVPHEVAHQWFYGLVGNHQGRDPWLDESFAEYAETLVNGTAGDRLDYEAPAPVRNRVGETMRWYADLENPALYGAGVYRQGGVMLHRARQAVGPATWDRLLRAYIEDGANQIVTDADVEAAFGAHPEALTILREYGALPR